MARPCMHNNLGKVLVFIDCFTIKDRFGGLTYPGTVTMNEKNNYTYMLRCHDNSIYTGWTNDMDKRLKAHNEGKGAKYTKARRPVTLVYYETFQTKEEAMRREWEIKQLNRQGKLKLIKDQSHGDFHL